MPFVTDFSPLRSSRLPSRRATIGTALALLTLGAAAAPVAAGQAVTASVHDGTLVVKGSPSNDVIVLKLAAGDDTTLEIDGTGDGAADFSFELAQFDQIHIEAGPGGDTVQVSSANGPFTANKPTTVDGGVGEDNLIGSAGPETFLGGPGDDTIDGNQGADRQFGGAGNDTIVWDPGDGSDLVEGGPGVDTMRFFGNGNPEIFRAFQNGDRVTFTRNLGNIVMDLNDTERIDLRAQGGADDLTVEDIVGTDLRQIDADLVSDGVGDHVTLNGGPAGDTFRLAAAGGVTISRAGAPTTRIAGADALLDSLVVNGLAGSDSFEVGQGVTGLIQLQTID